MTTKLTYNELIAQLFIQTGCEDSPDYNDGMAETLFSDYGDEYSDEAKLAEKLYGYEKMDGEYGGEGEGEYCYGVIRLDGRFFRAEWSYYSYNGCEFDGIADSVCEVKAVTEMVTVYR